MDEDTLRLTFQLYLRGLDLREPLVLRLEGVGCDLLVIRVKLVSRPKQVAQFELVVLVVLAERGNFLHFDFLDQRYAAQLVI